MFDKLSHTKGRLGRGAVAGVLAGGLALGSAGVALAATSGGPAGAAGGGAKATGTFSCSDAPAMLARIAKREAAVQKLAPQVSGWVTQVQGDGLPSVAKRLQRMESRLQKAPGHLQFEQSLIQTACPGATASGS